MLCYSASCSDIVTYPTQHIQKLQEKLRWGSKTYSWRKTGSQNRRWEARVAGTDQPALAGARSYSDLEGSWITSQISECTALIYCLIGCIVCYSMACVLVSLISYFSAIKKNSVLCNETDTTRNQLETITLSEINQLQKDKWHLFSLIMWQYNTWK